jgi:hypothetical protein
MSPVSAGERRICPPFGGSIAGTAPLASAAGKETPAGRTLRRLERFADRGVDERGQLAAATPIHDADEIAEERRIRALAALMGCDARELEKLLDVPLRQVEGSRVFARGPREPVSHFGEPVVHGRSLDFARP